MNNFYSLALLFCAGVIAGVVGVWAYQVYRKPAMPTDTLYDIPDDDLAEVIDAIREAMAMDDTQPVYIGQDENEYKPQPWDPDYQMGEMILGDSHVAKRNEKYNETISDESESGKIVCSKCGVVYRGSVNLREICTVCGKILIESEE